MACTVCGSQDLKVLPSIAGFALAQCRACTHVFVAQSIDERQLDSAYREDYYKADAVGNGYDDYVGSAERRISGFRHKVARIERYAAKRGSILDYGCAVGFFLKAAQERGWVGKGYERSEWAVEYGRRVLGLDIELAREDIDPFSAEAFDAVVLWDAIEHLDHPRQVIESIRRWLKPGGLLAVSTINSSSLGARLAGRTWRHFAPPHHLQFFTRRSLLRCLDDAGFDVKEVSANGVCFGSSADHLAKRGWRMAADEVIGHWRARKFASALNLLDEIQVIALKR
jgi:2-polyprenyl-3-methyl-5-hydroxy-6-metoxy-1,4-benzoquinol methylase